MHLCETKNACCCSDCFFVWLFFKYNAPQHTLEKVNAFAFSYLTLSRPKLHFLVHLSLYGKFFSLQRWVAGTVGIDKACACSAHSQQHEGCMYHNRHIKAEDRLPKCDNATQNDLQIKADYANRFYIMQNSQYDISTFTAILGIWKWKESILFCSQIHSSVMQSADSKKVQ